MRTLSLLLCAMFMLVLASCGGGGDNEIVLPPAPAGSGGGAAANAPPASATLRGKVAWEGEVPAAGRIQMTADPYCAQNGGNATSEEVVVSDGGLENVIIYVSSPVTHTFATPTEEIVLDQKGCRYTPHVFTAMVDQPVKVRNSDATLHNVHTFPMKNASFNVGQPRQGMENITMFDMEETPVPVRCDVHRWMGAFGAVFSHPYHATSRAGGTYEIKLPPGTYQITTWHEKHGTQTQMVTVADGTPAELNFTYSAASAPAAD